MRLHFARLDVERGYDFVEVLNLSTGEVLDRFTGELGEMTTAEYDTPPTTSSTTGCST